MYIKVRAIANAKKESLEVFKDSVLKISVREKAEYNLANKRIVELVAGHFHIPAAKVKIVNGHHHPHKLLSLDID